MDNYLNEEQKKEDKKRIFKTIFETIFVAIVASLYWKILGRSIKEVILISVAFIIVIIYLNYTPQKRLELFKWKKEFRRRGLKTRWMLWLGWFLAFLSFLFYKFYPESDIWVFVIIPAILLLATDFYRPSFLFKK